MDDRQAGQIFNQLRVAFESLYRNGRVNDIKAELQAMTNQDLNASPEKISLIKQIINDCDKFLPHPLGN